jgi:hypothetical protein
MVAVAEGVALLLKPRHFTNNVVVPLWEYLKGW